MIVRASDTLSYEIPDAWWEFCEMNTWQRSPPDNYAYTGPIQGEDFRIVPISEIEPIERDLGDGPMRKYKMVSVLMAFQTPYPPLLPPIGVELLQNSAQYKYKLRDGTHRYIASLAVGYPEVPVYVWDGV